MTAWPASIQRGAVRLRYHPEPSDGYDYATYSGQDPVGRWWTLYASRPRGSAVPDLQTWPLWEHVGRPPWERVPCA